MEYDDDDEFDDFIDKGGDEVEDDMLSRFSSMTLKGAPVKSGGCFNVSEEPTWLIYDFVQNDKHYCCVDVLTLTMGRDKFRPRVSANGRKVMVEMVKPKFFFDYERMENYHSNDCVEGDEENVEGSQRTGDYWARINNTTTVPVRGGDC